MGLRVVGAGLGRTGTNSLKLALEQLLGGRCYHMLEVRSRPQDVPMWEDAVAGRPVDWQARLADFEATVDWPAAAFWRELHAANPQALVLLSTRDSPEVWWRSMEKTIVPTLALTVPEEDTQLARQRAMTMAVLRTRFAPDWPDRDAMIAAYERHNREVREAVPSGQLIDWRPGDGWEPICEALGIATPAEPFPHENTTADFRTMIGLDERAD